MNLSPTVREQHEFLRDVAKLIMFIEASGLGVTAGEMFRTREQQEIYVKTGRSKTYNSYHLRRLAVDFNFFDSTGKLTYDLELLRPVGEFWESLHEKNSAGMFWRTFEDVPHFERRA